MIVVNTGLRQAQPLDGAAMHEMFGNNLLYIHRLDEAVPDGLRVHDDDGAMLALIEAGRVIGPNLALEACVLDGVLEDRLELAASSEGAAGTRGALISLVGADKNMVLIERQGGTPVGAGCGASNIIPEMRGMDVSATIDVRCSLIIFSLSRTI